MNDTQTEAAPTRALILDAARALSMVCDGAHEKDGAGYNGCDSPVAKSILKSQNPTDNQIRCLWNILRKYSGQLERRGFQYEMMVPPPLPPPAPLGADGKPAPYVPAPVVVKLLWADTQYGRRIAIASTYSADVVMRIKRLEKRWFDKEGKNSAGIKNAWLIPDEVMAFDNLLGALEEIEPAIKIEIAQDLKDAMDAFRQEKREAYLQSRAETSELEVPTKLPPRPFQRAGIQWAVNRKGRALIADDMGLGKAQPIDAQVLTMSGWVKIGSLRVGDSVVGSDGRETKVLGVFPQGVKEILRVTFSDGSFAECCEDHLWTAFSPCMKMRGTAKTLALKEIRKKLFDGAGNARWYIPMVQPVEFPDKELPIDPYFLGTLIGNGTLKNRISISLSGDDAAELVTASMPDGMRLRKNADYNYNVAGAAGTRNIVQTEIRALGLNQYSEERFIPEGYKFSSIDQRIALLNGLMDTDGYVSKDGMAVQYTTVSKKLSDDVVFLVESLGGRAMVSSKIPTFTYKGEKKKGQLAYTITVCLPKNIPTFRLGRKADRLALRGIKYLPSRAIVKVEPVRTFEAICISVEASDGLYVTDRFIVTHNTCQALGYLSVKNTALPAVVLCPATLRGNWVAEAAKFTGFKCQIITAKSSLKGLRKAGFTANERPEPGYDLTILNYDLLSTETIKSWIKMLHKGDSPYAHEHLVKSGRPAVEKIVDAMMKKPGIDINNRLQKVKQEIEALKGEARGMKEKRYFLSFVNGMPLEEFLAVGFKTLIADEIHYLKDPKSQRGMAGKALSDRMESVLGLTGTPIMNRPMEIWNIVNCISPKVFPSSFDFGKRYCNGHETRFGWDFSGSSNLEELDEKLRTTVMIRRMKTQVLKELPAKIRITMPMALENIGEYEDDAKDPIKKLKLLKKQRDEWKEALSTLTEEERKKFISEHAQEASEAQKISGMMIDEFESLKQAAVKAKFSECVKFILDLQEAHGKIIVFMSHHEFIDRMVEELQKAKLSVEMIDGRVAMGDRDAIKNRFQEGDTQMLVCGIRAASEGLTLTASHTVVFVELDWNPARHYQCEDRVHRMGQTVQPTMYYLVGVGTIEESIARMIDSKREVVNSSLGEGDRTVNEDGILDAILQDMLK